MKFQKRLASAFAAAALAVGLSVLPAMADENKDTAPAEPNHELDISATKSDTATAKTSMAVEWDPLLPVGAIGGMGAVTALLLAMGLRQRKRGTLLRAFTSAAFLTAIANPTVMQQETESLPTQVAILVDQSASQNIDSRAAQTADAQAKLSKQLSALGNVEVRVIEVGGPQQGVAVNGTKLFDNLKQNLADIPASQLGAVVILTDGQSHDELDKIEETITPDTPVHVLVSGKEDEHDRRIELESAPLYGVVDQDTTIRFRIIDDGIPSENTGRVLVTLRADGKTVTSKYVTPGESAEISANIPHSGANILELRTEAIPGELTDINNRVVTTVQGIHEKLRVLLLSGEPNAGSRVWQDMLSTDPAVELVPFTILRPPGKDDEAPLKELSLISLPTQKLFEDKLDDFDLVIMDRYQYRGILPPQYMEKISSYVDKGGALLVVSGPEYAGSQSIFNTPLQSVLPTKPTGSFTTVPYRPDVNERGAQHPVTRNLEKNGNAAQQTPSWGRWFRIIDVESVSGDVVMEGADDRPLLILNRDGEGRVAQLLSDNAWLWARGYEGGGPYADMFAQTVHWLMKDPALEEEALRSHVKDGTLIIERQTMGNTTNNVTVKTPSGETQTVTLKEEEPGLWRATLPAKELGLYEVKQDDKRAFAGAGTASPKEFAPALSSTEILAPLTNLTGGKINRLSAAADDGELNVPAIEIRKAGEPMKGKDWIGIKESNVSILQDSKRIPLMTGFIGLSLLLGLTAAAYHREGGGFNKLSWRRKNEAPKNNGPKGP